MQQVTDASYEAILENKKVILYLTLSYCHFCEKLKPFIEELAKKNPDITFGECILNNGHLIKLKRGNAIPFYVPAVLMFKKGRCVLTLESGCERPVRIGKIIQAINKEMKP